MANRIFEIDNQKLFCYEGDYEYYLTKYREQKQKDEVGIDYGQITDSIRRLECELAFLSGKLNEILDEEEKASLNKKFFATVKELNKNKELLKK